MEKHEVDILLGSKALREGVDLTHVRSEINATGDKSPIGVIQQKGRGERICHDDKCQICAYYGKKTHLVLHDLYDFDPTKTGKTEKERHWLESHSIERLRAYESRGYKVKIQ
jgi:superfamily II DNA or RNA helicase